MIYMFLKKPLGIYRFVTLPLGNRLSPLEIPQICATPLIISKANGKSTTFSYSPLESPLLSQLILEFLHAFFETF